MIRDWINGGRQAPTDEQQPEETPEERAEERRQRAEEMHRRWRDGEDLPRRGIRWNLHRGGREDGRWW